MGKTKTLLRVIGSISILYIVLTLCIMSPLATLAHAQEGGATPEAPAEQQATEAKININTATEQDLLQLKRLTPDLAKRIVAYREKKGPFKKTEDIRKVKGIGPKFWQANEDRITVEEGATEKKEETGSQAPETTQPAQPPQEVTPPPNTESAPKAEGTVAPVTEEKEAAPAPQETTPPPEGEKAVPPQEAK